VWKTSLTQTGFGTASGRRQALAIPDLTGIAVRDRQRPEANSLRLLPSGPDRVGDCFARASLSLLHIERPRLKCESWTAGK